MAAENEKMDIDSLASQMDEGSPEVDNTEHSEAVETEAAEQSQVPTAANDSTHISSNEPNNSHNGAETCASPDPEPTAKADCVVGDGISASEKCEVVPLNTSNQDSELCVGGSDGSPSMTKLEADTETNGGSIMQSEVAGEPTEETGPAVSGAFEETGLDVSATTKSVPPIDVIEDVQVTSSESQTDSPEG